MTISTNPARTEGVGDDLRDTEDHDDTRRPDADEGVGNIGPGDATGLEPGDDGVGNIGPGDATGLEPGDDGLGNIGPGDATGLEPGDDGLGNIEGELAPDPDR